jgi:AraC-like DNA-binding protein
MAVQQRVGTTPLNESGSRQLTVYYWRRGFVLLAPSFALDRSENPYRRLSATLMLAFRNPFTLETGDGDCLEARAALIAPKVLRRRICADNSDIVIFDLAVATPEFHALASILNGASVRELDFARVAALAADFACAQRGELDAEALRGLLYRTIVCLTGLHPQPPQLDPRIAHVLQLIEEQPLNAVSLSRLAGQVHLSASRLRHLFQQQTGCSLTHYLRWSAVWKGIWLWSRARPWIEVAEAAGFYDYAHINRAFYEVFGMNPSMIFSNPNQVRLIRCDWE